MASNTAMGGSLLERIESKAGKMCDRVELAHEATNVVVGVIIVKPSQSPLDSEKVI
jgi:hypothetical protein